jgi:sugar lactone lactonase YvrE
MRPKPLQSILCIAAGIAVVAAVGAARADDYDTRVVISGLERPTGIALRNVGRNVILYYTEVPTPGVPGDQGGRNKVSRVDLRTNQRFVLHEGEPEPVNIAAARGGALYWTCKSAGVVLCRDRLGRTSALLTELEEPNGIAVAPDGAIYFTELPTPGVGGDDGGTNRVSVFDGSETTVLHMGDPEPSDVAVAPDGTLYWTCTSAGVIVKRTPEGEASVLLDGLDHPLGIALSRDSRTLYFTEVPTPGVPGQDGGENAVWRVDLSTLELSLIDAGDPEPTDIAVSNTGVVYWTCSSAGVIVEATRQPD